ncbi:energy transducer TonB [Sphingomonas sp.]|uniref:energy transducer TonB n=1 Tax=Sphingomonas sp. TaxID=28214 RepID=UPI0025F800B2|nr:energy transducer TonB [Sphingomonas sp.]
MAYSDDRKGFSPASIGTVVAVHVAIGYAFISGLAYQAIHTGPLVTTARLIPADPVPPPKMPPPETRPAPAAPRPVMVDRIVHVPLTPLDPMRLDPLPPIPQTFPSPEEALPTPQPKPAPLLTRSATPDGDRAGWVTTDDYPPSALREGVEGIVGIDVAIDARGRVTACTVTGSSGSDLLDQATCRLYARRAHFRPALDEAGQPTASHRADRVRWQIPG